MKVSARKARKVARYLEELFSEVEAYSEALKMTIVELRKSIRELEEVKKIEIIREIRKAVDDLKKIKETVVGIIPSPNLHLRILMKDVRDELVQEANKLFGLLHEDVVVYVDGIKFEHGVEIVPDNQIWVLGGIAFEEPMSGRVSVDVKHKQIFTAKLTNETFVLMEPKMVFPKALIRIRAKKVPVLYVVKCEQKGMTIA